MHRFNDKGKEDAELAGFIASLFAYGNRKMFISKLNDLFVRADNDIANYVKMVILLISKEWNIDLQKITI